jgi:hypothetical protein
MKHQNFNDKKVVEHFSFIIPTQVNGIKCNLQGNVTSAQNLPCSWEWLNSEDGEHYTVSTLMCAVPFLWNLLPTAAAYIFQGSSFL